MMKISVIIPTYKPQSYIWECLDSLCNQTFPKDDFEVVLVLNGCKEPYDGQIREYMSSHPDVQWNFIQTDEGGVSNARNIGLDATKGEYITFVDDDDYVSGVYLEELYKKAAANIISVSNTVAYSTDMGGVKYSVTFIACNVITTPEHHSVSNRFTRRSALLGLA